MEEASSLAEGLWRAKQLSERVQLEADKAKEGVGTSLSLVPALTRLLNHISLPPLWLWLSSLLT